MKHVNAEDVLPKDLVRRIRRHITGYLYVSSQGERCETRRTAVLALRDKGMNPKEIGARLRITVRRVQQILAE